MHVRNANSHNFLIKLTLENSLQQTSIVTQESPIVPQDALLDSSVPSLLLASSSAPDNDEILLKQVRHSLNPSKTEK